MWQSGAVANGAATHEIISGSSSSIHPQHWCEPHYHIQQTHALHDTDTAIDTETDTDIATAQGCSLTAVTAHHCCSCSLPAVRVHTHSNCSPFTFSCTSSITHFLHHVQHCCCCAERERCATAAAWCVCTAGSLAQCSSAAAGSAAAVTDQGQHSNVYHCCLLHSTAPYIVQHAVGFCRAY